jgi:hypothetical protein
MHNSGWSLQATLTSAPELLRTIPIAVLNLLCATQLPEGCESSLPQCIDVLSEWARVVKVTTGQLLPRFRRAPSEFENSEAYFRVLVMITVLQRDLGVRYDPTSIQQRKFKNSREAFIHGLLTGDKAGTCANMPVLYAAIGRALGYPIYLVCAKGHFFCRWHSMKTGERFNIEASGHGLNTFSDEHYMTWPRPIAPAEVEEGVYLRNLEPAEEFAHFMALRGHCLRDAGHLHDAIVAYAHAHRLAPADPVLLSFLFESLNYEIDQRAKRTLPATPRQAEVLLRERRSPVTRYIIDDRRDGPCEWREVTCETGPRSSATTQA